MAAECPTIPLLTGQAMPVVGLGTWQSTGGEVGTAVKYAVDAGYRHIDTARGYMNEGEIGEALEEVINDGKVTREEMFITTKLSGASAFPSRVREQTEHSLKLLRTDYVDLLLIHFPITMSDVDIEKEPEELSNLFPDGEDGRRITTDTEPTETYAEMEKLVDDGLVKAIGLSNFNKEQIEKVWEAARIKPSNLQCECHAWLPQDELIEFCKEKGMTFTAYAPIGSPGRLTAERDGESKVLLNDPVVGEVAENVGRTPAQVLMKFLLQKDIIIIPKSVNEDRITSNIQLFDFSLCEEDMEKLKGINRELRLFTFDWVESELGWTSIEEITAHRKTLKLIVKAHKDHKFLFSFKESTCR